RLVNQDRNYFAACMVALGEADAMVSGVTRSYATVLDDVLRVVDAKPGHRIMGVTIALTRGRAVVIADTAVTETPDPQQLAAIAVAAAGVARRMGYEPRVALLASSTFGNPPSAESARVREALKILEKQRIDFEVDGEMTADVALN